MITTALILAGSLFGHPAVPTPHPVVPHVAVRVAGGCSWSWNATTHRMAHLAYVEFFNTGNVSVGIGSQVTFPDVPDDGTLSELGIQKYAVYAPGQSDRWAAQFHHMHLVARYPGNETTIREGTDLVVPVIEQLDEDVVCAGIPAP